MPKLTLDEAVKIRTDYLSNLSITDISEKYKISPEKVKKVLTERDETAKRLSEENIQIKFDVQTQAIQTFNDEALSFLREAIKSAKDSDQPHLFIDKVSSAVERMDRISRLNLNRATEIKQTNTTHTSFDVAEMMKTLDTPQKRTKFLQDQVVQSRKRQTK
jgi:hypothetical protein